MAEQDAATVAPDAPLDTGAPPATGAPPTTAPPTTAQPEYFEDSFKPEAQGQEYFEDSFKPRPASPSLIPGIGLTGSDYDSWSDYMQNSPSGKIMRTFGAFGSAFGGAFKGPGFSDELTESLRKDGVLNDFSAAQDDTAKTYGQAIARPIVNAMRGLNQWIVPPVVAGVDLLGRTMHGLEAGAVAAGKEAGVPGLGQLAAEVVEFETQRGDIMAHQLPEPIARGRATATIGEGEEGHFGTSQPTAEDIQARADAAGEMPPQVIPETVAEAATAPEVTPETPPGPAPTVDSVARQANPVLFKEYDTLDAQSTDLSRWQRELPEQTRANIEAKPPSALQEIDRQIADLERKSENAGARRRKQFDEQLHDLHDQRADLVDDLVRNHPDMTTVREAAEKVRGRMAELAPEVNAAYREARAQVPEEASAAAEVPPAEAPAAETPTEQAPAPPVPGEPGVAEPGVAEPGVAEPVSAAVAAPTESGPEQAAAENTAESANIARETSPNEVSSPDQINHIANDLQSKLVAMGRDVEQARAEASVVAAYWDTWARRLDGKLGTAREMYDKFQPPLRRGRQYAEAKREGAEVGQSAHGKTTFYPDGRRIVTMFKTANASTFMHEMGHVWLDDLLRFAEHPDAPAEVKADAKAVLDWLGAKDSTAVRETTKGGNFTAAATKKHETFARGVERYMMEGRAPTRALQRVFDQFKEWLTALYRSVDRLKAPINDEIRGVFDRILGGTPERAVIAREETAGHTIADVHEADAETTPPAQAEPVSDRIHTEFASEVRTKAPEVVPDVKLEAERAGEAGAGAPQRAGAHGGEPAAGPDAGAAGHVQEPGEVGAGRGEAAPERSGRPEGAKQSGLYLKVPKEPTRLTTFLKKLGGLKDVGGDIEKIFGNRKAAKGLLNDARGKDIEDATRAAWEAGYFPDYPAPGPHGLIEDEGRGRPGPDVLIEAIDRDRKTPQYSEFDRDKVAEYEGALGHNHEIDRIANDLGIDQKGLPPEQFWDKVAERMSAEDQAREIESMADARAHDEAEMERIVDDHEAETPEHAGTEPAEGTPGARGPDGTAAGEGTGQERPGQGGGGDGAAGGDSAPAERGGLPDDVAKSGAAKLGERGFNPEAPFVTDKDGKILAGNIRLENLRMSDDVRAYVREWVKAHEDLNSARYNEESYRLEQETNAHQALLCDVSASAYNAEKIFAENPTPENASLLKQWEDRVDMVTAEAMTMRASAGRTLAAYRNMKTAAQIMEELRGADLFQMQQQAKLNARYQTPAQLAAAIRWQKLTPWGKTRKFIINFFTNNILSGPYSHMAYMVSNQVTAVLKAIAISPVAATIGEMRQLFSDNPVERVHYRESFSRLMSLSSAGDALKGALEAVKSGVPPMLPGESTPQLALGGEGNAHAIPGLAGKLTSGSLHVIAGIHTFGSEMAFQAEMSALITRQALHEGLSGDAFANRVAELKKNPPLAMYETAAPEARKMILMNRAKWDSLTADIARFSNKWLLAKLALPVVQVPMRLLYGGLVDMNPLLGPFVKDIRDNLMGRNGSVARDMQAAKMVVGVGIASSVLATVAAGRLTGAEPRDPKEAAVWRLTGKQPYSFNPPGTDVWIPYRKWLSFYGDLVSMSANLYSVGHAMSHEGVSAAASTLVFGFGEVVGDESWAKGISDVVDAAKNWQTKGAHYLRNLGLDFIPYSIGLSQIARSIDPYQRRANGFIEEAMNKIPYLSERLMPQRDILGDPIASHTQVTPTTINNDPVLREMNRVGYWPAPVGKKIRGVELNEQQYDDYARIAGRLMKQTFQSLVQTPGWNTLPANVRYQMMHEAVSRPKSGIREVARSTIMAQSKGTANDIIAKSLKLKTQERADRDE